MHRDERDGPERTPTSRRNLGLVAVLALTVACRAGVVPGPASGPVDAAVDGGNAATPPQVTAPPQVPAGTQAPGAFDPNALRGSASLGPGANAPLRAVGPALEAAAAATGVSADVLAGIAWAESRAVPSVAGGGLMQMSDQAFAAQRAAHPEVVGEVAEAGPNATAAAFYLLSLQATMRGKYGRDELGIVLRAYNSGENGVDPADLTRTPAGTGAAPYVDNVTAYARVVATGGGNLPP